MTNLIRRITWKWTPLLLLSSFAFISCNSNSNSGHSSDIHDPAVTGYDSGYLAPETGSTMVPTSTFNYIVEGGDSLWKLARENNTTVQTIKELNNLQDDLIRVGDTLILPGTETVDSPPAQ